MNENDDCLSTDVCGEGILAPINVWAELDCSSGTCVANSIEGYRPDGEIIGQTYNSGYTTTAKDVDNYDASDLTTANLCTQEWSVTIDGTSQGVACVQYE